MNREVGNWLRAYAEYTKELESPDSYHLWSALSVLASAVRRRVWLNQGHFQVYPNMFVILVGPPGKVNKSTSIRAGRRLLLGVEDINFGADSLTREELIRQLAKVGMQTKQSALTIHSTELSSLIEPSGVKMIQFLTDIYDGDFKWRYATKGSGRDTIHNPVINILAGTTPSWIAEGLPSDVVGHGFTSRVIFVFEDEPRFLNPRPAEPDPELIAALTRDLNLISELKGEFSMTPKAETLYDYYYREVYKHRPRDYRIEGYHWRKAKAHLLKVAMLLSISESDRLAIREEDIETAWTLLQNIEPKMHQTFSAVGKFEYASDLERILGQINENGGISKTELIERNFAVGDLDQIGKLISMLIAMNKVERTKKDNETFYIPVKRIKK